MTGLSPYLHDVESIAASWSPAMWPVRHEFKSIAILHKTSGQHTAHLHMVMTPHRNNG